MKYFKTFEINTFSGIARIFGLSLFTICFAALLLYVYIAFEIGLFLSFNISIINASIITLILDLTMGIGREGPLFKKLLS